MNREKGERREEKEHTGERNEKRGKRVREESEGMK